MTMTAVSPQENFRAWMDEHYKAPRSKTGLMICRRCGMPVGYLTKHAVVRHGDAIEVMPSRNENPKLAERY